MLNYRQSQVRFSCCQPRCRDFPRQPIRIPALTGIGKKRFPFRCIQTGKWWIFIIRHGKLRQAASEKGRKAFPRPLIWMRIAMKIKYGYGIPVSWCFSPNMRPGHFPELRVWITFTSLFTKKPLLHLRSIWWTIPRYLRGWRKNILTSPVIRTAWMIS